MHKPFWRFIIAFSFLLTIFLHAASFLHTPCEQSSFPQLCIQTSDGNNNERSTNHCEKDKDSLIIDLLHSSEVAYQLYIKRRKGIIRADTKTGVINETQYPYFPWYYLRPAFSCPYSKQRIGADQDGGKWVCGFEIYEHTIEDCIVYSFGGRYESSFEAEFLARTNCIVYGFDGSVDGMGAEIQKQHLDRMKFSKTYIGPDDKGLLNGTSRTLGQLMRENEHKSIDVLKMDIELSEFSVLDQVMDEFDVLPFSQLQLEMHENFTDIYHLWERMEQKGLRAFEGEINPFTMRQVGTEMKPLVYEYAFINIFQSSKLVPQSLLE